MSRAASAAPAAMDSQQVVAASRRRVDPFRLPGTTGPRFALLILMTLAAGIYVANTLYLSWGGSDAYAAALQQCFRTSPVSIDAQSECIQPMELRAAVAAVAGAVALLGIAGLACLLIPHARLRRRGLRSVGEDVPELTAAFERLAGQAGLARTPSLVWNPLEAGSAACAFGAFGRYYVSIGSGLAAAFYRRPDLVEALLRHELAHVANRDVTKTYFAIALWWAFLVAGVVPFGIAIADNGASQVLEQSWRLLAIAAAVYLTRAMLLRGRESYADLRASEWEGPDGALAGALELAEPEKGLRSRLPHPLQKHPAAKRRLETLLHPEGTLLSHPTEMFLSGLAAGLVFIELADLIGKVLIGNGLLTERFAIAAVLATPLAVGAMIVTLWREGEGRLWHRTRSRLLFSGAALGVGIFVGSKIALGSALADSLGEGEGATGWVRVVSLVAFGVVLGLWVHVVARAWLTRLRGRGPLRLTLLLTALVAAAAFAWGLGQAGIVFALGEADLIGVAPAFSLRHILEVVFLKPVTYCVLAALLLSLAIPLAFSRHGAPAWMPEVPTPASRKGPSLSGSPSYLAVAALAFVCLAMGGAGLLVGLATAGPDAAATGSPQASRFTAGESAEVVNTECGLLGLSKAWDAAGSDSPAIARRAYAEVGLEVRRTAAALDSLAAVSQPAVGERITTAAGRFQRGGELIGAAASVPASSPKSKRLRNAGMDELDSGGRILVDLGASECDLFVSSR